MKDSVSVYAVQRLNQISSKALHLSFTVVWSPIANRYKLLISLIVIHNLTPWSILQDQIQLIVIWVVYHLEESNDISVH